MNTKAEELKKLIEEIGYLLRLHWKTPDETVWIKKVERYLKKNFGEDSDYYKQFHDSAYGGLVIVTSSMTDADHQHSRSESLNKYRILLESFLEEIKNESEDRIQNKQQKESSAQTNDKFMKLEEELKASKLEAERRKAVVESKSYGAQIEIITALRKELKSKDETINNLKQRLDKIEQHLVNKTSGGGAEEDIWYNELNAKTEGSGFTKTIEARKESKRLYSKIKLLKKEIAELVGKSSRTSHYPTIHAFGEQIEQRKSQVDALLKQLADLWSEYT